MDHIEKPNKKNKREAERSCRVNVIYGHAMSCHVKSGCTKVYVISGHVLACIFMSCYFWSISVMSCLVISVCVVIDCNESDYNDEDDVIVPFSRFYRCGFLFGHQMRIRR